MGDESLQEVAQARLRPGLTLGDDVQLCGFLKRNHNPERRWMMSYRWSGSGSRDGEAAGIFRGYIWVKKQSQQPHPHLVIWLLAVTDSYSEQLDS